MKLLVSVRSVDEARAALAGGADVIDIKEPARGSLGKADNDVIAAIAGEMAGKAVVSAALGELYEARNVSRPLPAPLAFHKYGVSSLCGKSWRQQLEEIAKNDEPTAALGPVVYADYQEAKAPTPSELFEYVAVSKLIRTVLIDTYTKDGRCLFDWLDERTLDRLLRQARLAGVQVALAGSLRSDHLPTLTRLAPDWIGVRGAACVGHDRSAVICPDRVRQLKAALA